MDEADLPRVPDAGFVVAPVVAAGAQRSFEGAQAVALDPAPHRGLRSGRLWYTLDGTAPVPGTSRRYTGPLRLDTTATLRALAVDAAGHRSADVRAVFVERPNDWTVALASTLRPPYDAGGPRGLTDGIRGTAMWRAGDWHGYQGQDFAATVDLRAVRSVHRLAAGFLQDTRSWILMPTAVTFETSADGVAWTTALRADNTVPASDYTTQTQTLGGALAAPVTARFVRVTATNYGPLPPWHLGAGYPAYIFVDEIEVE